MIPNKMIKLFKLDLRTFKVTDLCEKIKVAEVEFLLIIFKFTYCIAFYELILFES